MDNDGLDPEVLVEKSGNDGKLGNEGDVAIVGLLSESSFQGWVAA